MDPAPSIVEEAKIHLMRLSSFSCNIWLPMTSIIVPYNTTLAPHIRTNCTNLFILCGEERLEEVLETKSYDVLCSHPKPKTPTSIEGGNVNMLKGYMRPKLTKYKGK